MSNALGSPLLPFWLRSDTPPAPLFRGEIALGECHSPLHSCMLASESWTGVETTPLHVPCLLPSDSKLRTPNSELLFGNAYTISPFLVTNTVPPKVLA